MCRPGLVDLGFGMWRLSFPRPQGAKGQDADAHGDQKETQNQICRDLGTAEPAHPVHP